MLFGLMGLTTGPLWAIKAWGVLVAMGCPRLTMALILELIFVSYMLLRAYGGPGLGEAGGRVGALRDGQRAVRVYLGEHMADDSSGDERTVPSTVGVSAWACSVPWCGACWRS